MREHCLITASQQSPWPHCSHPQGTHCLLRMMSNSKGLRHRLALSTPVYQHLRTPPCPVLIPSFLWRFLPFLLLGPLLLVFHQHHLLVALLHLCPVQNVHLLSLISHPNHHIHVFHCHPVQNSHMLSLVQLHCLTTFRHCLAQGHPMHLHLLCVTLPHCHRQFARQERGVMQALLLLSRNPRNQRAQDPSVEVLRAPGIHLL